MIIKSKMTQEEVALAADEILAGIDESNKMIVLAQGLLELLQSICTHPNKVLGSACGELYSICTICRKEW